MQPGTGWVAHVRAENEANVMRLRNWAATQPYRPMPTSPRNSPRKLAPIGTIPAAKTFKTWKPPQPRSNFPEFSPRDETLPTMTAGLKLTARPAAQATASTILGTAKPGELTAQLSSQKSLNVAANSLQRKFADKVETQHKLLRKAFLNIDKDRSGTLTVDEIRSALQNWNLYQESPERFEKMLKALFARADADGNGTIDYEEFAANLAHSTMQEVNVFGADDDETGMMGHVVANHFTRGGGKQVLINDNLEIGRRVEGTGIRIQGTHTHGNFKHAIDGNRPTSDA